MERYYYLTANLYDGTSWMTRPGVLVFAALLVVPALWSLLKRLRGASGAADDGHRDEHATEDADGDELEGSLAGTSWSAAVAVASVALFAAAFWVSGSFSEEARLMPRLVAVLGLVAALALVGQELRARRHRAEPAAVEPRDGERTPAAGGTVLVAAGPDSSVAVDRRHDILIAARTFAAMAAFLVLTTFGGYLAATLIFTPMFLLYAARVRPRTAIVYTLVLGVVLLLLPSLLPVDLPMGVLQ